MTGADYVDAKITLPLRWLLIGSILVALPLAWTARYKKAIILVAVFFGLQLIVPVLVGAVYVRPNEISIERPYIEDHIAATTAAFGLNRNATERSYGAEGTQTVDPAREATVLDNVRLWDLRAYSSTITQIQALRPYYTFPAHRRRSLFLERADQASAAVAAGNRRRSIAGRGQPELDQSTVYLYAWLRRGGVRGQ